MLSAPDEWGRLSEVTRSAMITRAATIGRRVIADQPWWRRWLVRRLVGTRAVGRVAMLSYFQGQLDHAVVRDLRDQQRAEPPPDYEVEHVFPWVRI